MGSAQREKRDEGKHNKVKMVSQGNYSVILIFTTYSKQADKEFILEYLNPAAPPAFIKLYRPRLNFQLRPALGEHSLGMAVLQTLQVPFTAQLSSLCKYVCWKNISPALNLNTTSI